MPTEDVRRIRENVAPSEGEHRELGRDDPLEESQKSYHTTLEQLITQGEEELRRPGSALLLSGFTAGLDLGFGPFAMAAVLTLTRDVFPRPVTTLLMASAYSLGFIFVVIGRSALFTEHTTSAVVPVLARRASVGALLRLWTLVLLANLVGGTLFAAVIALLAPALGVADSDAFAEIARPMLEHSAMVTLLSAILAGWLMGLLSWLLASVRDSISQVLIVSLVTMLIALGKLHHSIAGSIEVLLALFAQTGVSAAALARFILLAVIGNAIGGAVFVALLKFGHVYRTAR